ncbi:MAG: YeeE/YedE family protein [Rubrivivax sp.]|jgi:uncharacterized membrane protein YedE/YeeE
MSIDWNAFTPVHAAVGGVVIGLASALFVLGNGRIAGIAGIVGSPLRAVLASRPLQPERTRLLFLLGLALAPWAWRLVAPLPAGPVDVSMGAVVLAGLLVGVGVRMGNGCTSGHGVCGLSRLSVRSLANVAAFMGAGFASVYLLRHVIG